MVRLLHAAVLVVLLGQVFVDSVKAERPCIEDCSGDLPDGTCPIGCDDCACCAAPRLVMAEPLACAPLQLIDRLVLATPAATPPSPAPRGIFKVPRLVLA